MKMENKKSLAAKIKEARKRTREWALGINVEFPKMPVLEIGPPKLTLKDLKPKNKAPC